MTSTLGIKKIQYPNGTNSITIDSSGSAAITTANITTANVTNATATGTITTPSINGGQIGGRRNLLINGAMAVAQRGTQATSISSNGYHSTDRMKFYESSSGVFTVEQVSDAPSGSGFQYSHKVTATTGDTSIAATDLICPLWYIVEKHDVDARLAYGTSSAKPITMSFWVKSNVTGTYTISAYRSASPARVQAQTYTISSANTWEFKTLTFLGDTAEAIDVDLNFYFNGLVGGSYDNTSTTSGWAGYNTSNWAGGHTATLFDTSNDSWQMTGLQLEVGSQATEFEHRSFGEELLLCQRYLQVIRQGIQGWCTNANGTCFWTYPLQPKLRAAPTITCTKTAYRYGDAVAIGVAMTSITVNASSYNSDTSAAWTVTGTASATPAQYRNQLLEPNSATYGSFLFTSEL